MIERFEGRSGHRRLLDCVKQQWLVHGDTQLANELIQAGQLEEYPSGKTIMEEGREDTDICFILSGAVAVLVHGRQVAVRAVRQHVGEMAMIDSAEVRSATVVAQQTVVLLRVQEPDFALCADTRPTLWRLLALELAGRLRQRNDLVQPRNEQPVVFVGSSTETKSAAEAIGSGLEVPPVIVRVWTKGIFRPSAFPVDDLLREVSTCDFAVLVLGADDQVVSRRATMQAPRDNVILEIGLFMGALGRGRTFLVEPQGLDLKIPSDLIGLTTTRYDPRGGPERFKEPCRELRDCILEEEPR